MLLAIDAGNTNIVFALFEGDRQRGHWRCATSSNRTGDEYAVWLTHLMALKGLKPVDVTAAIIASVVPGAIFNLKMLCREHFGCEPLIVGEKGVQLDVCAVVERANEVGADRLVNAISAAHTYRPPLIVIDFGTATTFDVVNGDGLYCGGAIAPGINLSLESLHRAAAKLPRVEVRRPDRVIGRDTVTCMQSGVFWGYVGMIEGIVARIRAEFGEPMRVIATGGLAGLFAEATSVIELVDDDVTLRGLRLIYERHKGQKGT